MISHRTVLSSLVLFFSSACTPGAPARTAKTPPGQGEEIPAALTDPSLPQAAETDRETPVVAKPLPELCAWEHPECASLRPAYDALEAGDPEEALERLAQLSNEAQAPRVQGARFALEGRAHLERASLAYGAGGEGAETALRLFERAVSLVEHKEPVVLQRARAQLALGRGDEALSDLRTLAEHHPDAAEVQAALGIAYLSTGRAARALEPLRRAVTLDPQQPERLIVLGTAHMLLGDLAEAERRFRGAISLDGSSARAHGDLGAVLLVQGKIGPGKSHLLRASRLDPSRATYASNLAYAELLGGDAKKALELAQQALKIDSNLASAWLNLGLAQVELGERKAARESFEKAQELDPTDPRPKNNLADLAEIEGVGPTPQ